MMPTKTDIAVLRYALHLEQDHRAIGPRGSSQHRQFDKLHKQGLLKYVGWGVDTDSESIDGRELLLYEITAKGRKLVAAEARRG